VVTCTTTINVKDLIGPMLLASVVKGEEVDVTPIIDMYVQQSLVNNLLGSITLPSDFADLGEIICITMQMELFKGLTAALRGEEYTFDLSKPIELIVSLNMISALSSAFA